MKISKSYYQSYAVAQQNNKSEIDKIIMLFEGAIKLMAQARVAVEQNEIELRFNVSDKVSQIFQGLINILDFDKGGEISEILRQFYSYIIMKVLQINHEPNVESCDQVIEQMTEMLDAWKDVKGQVEK
ncbi:flagellar export chaperone FliS [Rickettsiales endosymbiont of Stachyamoeba lipophora]|uniref:flagellar export chaperone FliS n=1 Tax=Rickettsiales endosymbiont of Stachyamoeba lipophora TaxID=2486578 RepID=UPI000F64773E|nr:flagellar export chaperone FliS [Rickettsiales endosymbiont of Stachyamoeba lipophora]AZL16437.1 flagellar export chaperone FliS [Rickettsiales endosymbiont of Stachyamoeba lipophora]